MNKHTHLLIPLVALATGACSIDLGFEDADPRAGDRGVLAFRSEGCTSTTVMAVGASAQLTLEALDGAALPPDLTVDSSLPTVIDASTTGEGKEVLVEALSTGSTYLSVHQMGRLLDGITLNAVPARSVKARSVERVLRGGHADVVIDEVMGVCDGQVCELFGSGFLSWRSEPSDAVTLAAEEGRVAGFTVAASGTLLGREPARGADLVKVPIVAVAPDEVTGFSASIVAVLEDGGAMATLPLPATVPADAYLCLRLDAQHPDGDVPLSSRDVTWSFDGIALDPIEGIREPLCTLIATGPAGQVTLRASSPLFSQQPSFELRLE